MDYHLHSAAVDPEDPSFQCPDCDLKTGAQFRLNIHRKKRGPLIARFTCPGCSYAWRSAHAYCSHYQVSIPLSKKSVK